jgi:hypothetical protein
MTPAVLTLCAIALAAFLLVLAIRTWQRERWALYVLVPVVLVFAASTASVIDHYLGYPTGDLRDLRNDFGVLYIGGDDPVYLLATTGGTVPRLYRVPKSALSAKSRTGMAEAQARLTQGIPQVGLFAEGEFVRHDFSVEQAHPKQ